MPNKNKVEILSPAGNMECLKAAVANGCNAVYLGGRSFSARAGAENFTNEEISEAIDYCHLRGVKVYITINTLYKNNELPLVLGFADKAYRAGADAFIVQDIGAAALIKKYFKDIKLHASTQMTAHSIRDVLFLAENGFDRVVLARELSLKEIEDITACGIEIEVFVHGALCVCFSGRCLMSGMLGGRSANRGKCAQPCRLKYELVKNDSIVKSGYLLSMRDLMAYDHVPQLISCGVTSFKIEGRMKSPEYVAIITEIYKKRTEEALSGNKSDEYKNQSVNKALSIFNRGGSFTAGYFDEFSNAEMISESTSKNTGVPVGKVTSYNKETGKCIIMPTHPIYPGDGIAIWASGSGSGGEYPGCGINKAAKPGERFILNIKGNISTGDLVYRTYDKHLMDEAKKSYEKDSRKIILTGKAEAITGNKVRLELSYPERDLNVKAEGSIVSEAKNNPLTDEDFIGQLGKTGGTPFIINFESIITDGCGFVSIRDINELRRRCVEEISNEIIKSYKRENSEYMIAEKHANSFINSAEAKLLTALVSNTEQLKACAVRGIDRIYIEARKNNMDNLTECIEICRDAGICLFVALPHISRDTSEEDRLIDILEESDIDGYLIRTFGQLYILKNTQKEIVVDFTLNIYNEPAASFYLNQGNVISVTLSPELNVQEIKSIGIPGEMVIYGRLPLMVTAQCPGKSGFCGKGKTDSFYLRDRTGRDFPVITDCEHCTATILNPDIMYGFMKTNELSALPVKYLRFDFTNETTIETENIIGSIHEKNFTSLSKAAMKDKTYGHMFRGVE